MHVSYMKILESVGLCPANDQFAMFVFGRFIEPFSSPAFERKHGRALVKFYYYPSNILLMGA